MLGDRVEIRDGWNVVPILCARVASLLVSLVQMLSPSVAALHAFCWSQSLKTRTVVDSMLIPLKPFAFCYYTFVLRTNGARLPRCTEARR